MGITGITASLPRSFLSLPRCSALSGSGTDQPSFVNSLYYTFGISPDYLAYNFTGAATNMKPSALMLVAIVLVCIAMVLPTLVYATASILIHGVKTVTDKVLLLFVLSFGLSLIVRRTPTPGS